MHNLQIMLEIWDIEKITQEKVVEFSILLPVKKGSGQNEGQKHYAQYFSKTI